MLFRCLVEPYGEKFKATSEDFPKIHGYGETPEQARESLKRTILEVWHTYRK